MKEQRTFLLFDLLLALVVGLIWVFWPGGSAPPANHSSSAKMAEKPASTVSAAPTIIAGETPKLPVASAPSGQDLNALGPGLGAKQDKIEKLLVTGRAQYLYGDYQGALQTFDIVLINDPNNVEAKAYEYKINQFLLQRPQANEPPQNKGYPLKINQVVSN